MGNDRSRLKIGPIIVKFVKRDVIRLRGISKYELTYNLNIPPSMFRVDRKGYIRIVGVSADELEAIMSYASKKAQRLLEENRILNRFYSKPVRWAVKVLLRIGAPVRFDYAMVIGYLITATARRSFRLGSPILRYKWPVTPDPANVRYIVRSSGRTYYVKPSEVVPFLQGIRELFGDSIADYIIGKMMDDLQLPYAYFAHMEAGKIRESVEKVTPYSFKFTSEVIAAALYAVEVHGPEKAPQVLASIFTPARRILHGVRLKTPDDIARVADILARASRLNPELYRLEEWQEFAAKTRRLKADDIKGMLERKIPLTPPASILARRLLGEEEYIEYIVETGSKVYGSTIHPKVHGVIEEPDKGLIEFLKALASKPYTRRVEYAKTDKHVITVHLTKPLKMVRGFNNISMSKFGTTIEITPLTVHIATTQPSRYVVEDIENLLRHISQTPLDTETTYVYDKMQVKQ